MEKKVWTMEEILQDCKKTELFSVDPKTEYAGITDSDERWRRLFKKRADGMYEEVDVKAMVKKISEYLAEHITLKAMLNDKLLHNPLEIILSLHKRVVAKGKVKEHKGCYYVTVAGEKGPALQLDL